VNRNTSGPVNSQTSLIVRLGAQTFAVDGTKVREMVSTPVVRPLPQLPPFVRGVINLRGRVMPLVDLRLRLGLPSAMQEVEALVEVLTSREEDHRTWLAELDASVAEERPFTLTTDPHACRFGKWYDTYRTDNVMLDLVLRRFDAPHRRIHDVGREVVDLGSAGRWAEAAALVATTRDTVLNDLVRLFDEARSVVQSSHREIAVVLDVNGREFATSVDGVESVERLSPDAEVSMDELIGGISHELVAKIARRAKDSSLVIVLRAEGLLVRDEPSLSLPDAA
jgi:purine-binding chemotaxis protein CheW